MPNSDHRKITVEDLLRLKRAERPAAEFWSNFEHELRQKQLTALMQKRPWWQELPRLFVRRAYLPVGAAAILGFTLVTIKYYAPLQLAPAAALSQQSESPPVRVDPAAVSSPLLNHDDPAARLMDDRAVVLVSAIPAPTVAANQTAANLPSVLLETPSARSIAANRARLEVSEPELMKTILGSRLSPSARMQTASAPMIELASLSTGAAKRSRMLANYSDRQLAPEPTAPALVRERLSRRLGDTDYVERFNRIGVRGDQVSLGLTIKL